MGQQQSIQYTPHVEWLKGKALNVYTQFGEDGLIATCLQRIGETNRQCFEIGAHDGRFFSNTLRLRELGWRAVLIEADELQAEKLINEFGEQSVCLRMLCKDLNEPLRAAGMSRTPDLGIIDIDGQDYWLWDDLKDFEPRIMLVEVSTRGSSEPPPERDGEGQAGVHAIKSLGESKGYSMVAETVCNALFVKSELLT